MKNVLVFALAATMLFTSMASAVTVKKCCKTHQKCCVTEQKCCK